MDPNNQNPQNTADSISKLEEDLQKLNNQVTSGALPVEAAQSPVQSLPVSEPAATPTFQQVPQSTELSQPPAPSFIHPPRPPVPDAPVASEAKVEPAPAPAFQIPGEPSAANSTGSPPKPPAGKSNVVMTAAIALMSVAVLAALAYFVGTKIFKKEDKPAVLPTPSPVYTPTPTASLEPETDSSSSAVPTTTPLTAPSKTIDIKSFTYAPNSLTLKTGEVVIVNNGDTVGHFIKEDTGLFDTGVISAGGTKTFTAPTKPGTYKFYCSAHPTMTGTIVVE